MKPFLRYVVAKYGQYCEEHVYRVYSSDMFLSIYSAVGGTSRTRYYDILHPAPEEKRSGDEIAVDVIERLGLKVV